MQFFAMLAVSSAMLDPVAVTAGATAVALHPPPKASPPDTVETRVRVGWPVAPEAR